MEEIMETDSFSVANHHVPSCGKMPLWAIHRPENSYFGYFENRHGEQWMFLATKDQMRLAGGDTGWDQLYEETAPDWKALSNATVQPGAVVLLGKIKSDVFKEIIFDLPEAIWLSACVRSAAECFGG
jgi:hypothetical protein